MTVKFELGSSVGSLKSHPLRHQLNPQRSTILPVPHRKHTGY